MNLKSITTASLILSGSLFAQTQTPDARITVNINDVRGKTPPLIFGHNLEAADEFAIFSKHHSFTDHGLWDAARREPSAMAAALARPLRIGALRYPGGCLAHNFNWKAAVGPVAERPDFPLGVDEWLRLCAWLGAEPVFTVSDYTGDAHDAANLVEYLNAPADDKHPWALRRKANGRAEPWGVRWFELGNESDHGNHDTVPRKKFSAEEYAAWAREYARRMKAVDPSVQVGVVTPPGDGRDADCEWNRVVLGAAGDFADFVVVHFYTQSVPDNTPPELLAASNAASMAFADQLGVRLRQYRELVRQHAGRDLPLAVTEFNVGGDQAETPVQYRFTFAAALHCADFLRRCLDESPAPLMVNYWQLFNGFWGAVRGTEPRHPAYALNRLWADFRGDDLLTVSVVAPRGSIAAGHGAARANGDVYQPAEAVERVAPPTPAAPLGLSFDGGTVSGDGEAFAVKLDNCNGGHYPTLFEFGRTPGADGGDAYVMEFEARCEGEFNGELLGLGLEDRRGWVATKSGINVSGLQHASEWRPFRSPLYRPNADTTGMRVLALLDIKRPTTATLLVRNLRITRWRDETLPSFPLLTVTAMKTGDTVTLLVFNKSLTRPLTATITVNDFPATLMRVEQLTPAAGDATSTAPPESQTGKCPIRPGPLTHTFPPCSMTGLVLRR